MRGVVKSGKLSNNKYALIGAGHMGGALLRGWINKGSKANISAKDILVIDPAPGEAAKRALSAGIRFSASLTKGSASGLQMCLIAVKPQSFSEVGAQLARALPMDCLVISIMAGINMEALRAVFSTRPIIRAMPNLPASFGSGITAYFGGQGVESKHYRLAESALAAVGEVVRVENEKEIDMVTAISGSGPAYYFYLTEILRASGEKLGLSPELAAKLARQTAIGSGVVLQKSNKTAADLRKSVTSPAGTTEAALDVLMNTDGLPDLMDKAVKAAFVRANELAKTKD